MRGDLGDVMEDYYSELMKLCAEPDIDEIKSFMAKWNPEQPPIPPEEHIAALAGLYKVRVTLGVKVEESKQWLDDHGLSSEIIPDYTE